MKTSEEIKRGLECCAGAARCKDCPYYSDNAASCGRNKNRDALAYIQQMEVALPRWISVDERLPERPDTVLINLFGLVNIAWYCGDGKFGTPSGLMFEDEGVTHWMPLPQPPKEEEK